VTDGATVPIYYESRLAKLELKESERPKIDPEFEEATEGEEVERREKLKTKWASSKLSSVPRTVSSLSPATWLSISTIGSRSWTARLWPSV
jgi:type I site-specific restriction-modification system R (restriction) subunit